jgi:hypothetical protein
MRNRSRRFSVTGSYDTATPHDGTDSDERFGFVIGTGRCGSSLVHDVLARHQGTAFLSNVQDTLGPLDPYGRLNHVLYRGAPAKILGLRRSPGTPSEAYRTLDDRVSTILSRPFRDLTAEDATPWLVGRVRRFFSRCLRAQRRSVFVHKFTGWPRAGFLEEALPGARFIHIIRDGRAVTNSHLQSPWAPYGGPTRASDDGGCDGPLPPSYEAEWERSGRSFVVLGAAVWKMLIDAFEEAQSKVAPGSWLEMRYEDVVSDPRTSFATMLNFLGLEWDDAFEGWFARYTFGRDRNEAFRSELRPADCMMLDEVLGDHLARYGYV